MCVVEIGAPNDEAGDVQDRGRRRLGREALRRVEVDDPAAEGPHDPPPTRIRAEADDDRGQDQHPQRDRRPCRGTPATFSARTTTPAVLAASCSPCPKAMAAAETRLASTGSLVTPCAGVRAPEDPEDRRHDEVAEDDAGDRRQEHRDDDLVEDPLPLAPSRRPRAPRRPARRSGRATTTRAGPSTTSAGSIRSRRPGRPRPARARRCPDGASMMPAADGLRHLGAEERADQVGDRRHHAARCAGSGPGSTPTSRSRSPRRETRSCS